MNKTLLGKKVIMTNEVWTKVFNKNLDYVLEELEMWIEMSDSTTFYVYEDEEDSTSFKVYDDKKRLLEFDY